MPPFVGGSPTLMYNLLTELDLSESVLVSQSKEGFSASIGAGYDPTVTLDIERKEVKGIHSVFARGSRFGLPSLALMLMVRKIVRVAKEVAKGQKPEVIFATWPSNAFAAAGYYAAKSLGIPMVFYLHDLWEETQRTPLTKWLSRRLEPKVFKGADELLVITEPTTAYLKEKYGALKSTVLEHSVNSRNWDLRSRTNNAKMNPKQFLMLGSVNKFNSDSVVSFSKALAKYDDVNLHILTGQSKETLSKIGLDVSKISCGFVSRDKLQETILAADVLYLALGFETQVQKEVEVVIPTRLMDYLPTGIPIIAHGPANVWTLQEAKNKNWGYCINSVENEKVEERLNSFMALDDYSQYVEGAWEEATRRDNVKQSAILARALNQAVNKSV